MAVSRDERFIASTYYESMRDNFEGYAWDIDPANAESGNINQQKADQLLQLKLDFEELDPEKGGRPKLGQLFKIELALVWLVPETALRARFWTIEDRFHRVVPRSVARSYRKTIADQPPGIVPDAVLRQRARNLLDTIHANYLINMAREQSIRRLMLILTGAAAIILASAVIAAFFPIETVQAILSVMIVGMAGAMISIIQRLQKATSRDAMVDDGIFELIGLRIGWVSILMSIAIGGVFALFIYVLVAAGVLDQVLPKMSGSDSPPSNSTTGGVTESCLEAVKDCTFWPDRMRIALGLGSRADLFKLFVYAFASGFAERFVPDIITKLTKDVLPGTGNGTESAAHSEITGGGDGNHSTVGDGQSAQDTGDSKPPTGDSQTVGSDDTAQNSAETGPRPPL